MLKCATMQAIHNVYKKGMLGSTSFISAASLNNFAAVVSDNLHNAVLSNFICDFFLNRLVDKTLQYAVFDSERTCFISATKQKAAQIYNGASSLT